jgi:hypothetical protein
MSNSIVRAGQTNGASPFDSIRRYDQNGKEYWSARELMKILGYAKWERFGSSTERTDGINSLSAIERARLSCQTSGIDPIDHFTHSPKGEAVTSKGLSVIPEDWKLSRHACYLVAMGGDVTKTEIAQAQSYFAIKTREAETVIPAQNDRIRELELAVRLAELDKEKADRQDTRITLHGLATTLLLEGKSDAVVEIEKPTIEIIDQRNNTRYEGQTLTQVKDFLAKKHGIKFKSGADIKRKLEQKKAEHLIAQAPRSVLSDYVPAENIVSVYEILTGLDRQLLLGE